MSGGGAPARRFVSADLMPRILVSLVLLPTAVFAVIFGGVWLAMVVGLTYAGVYREWETMITGREPSPAGIVLTGLIGLSAIGFASGGLGVAALIVGAAFAVAVVTGGDALGWRLLGLALIGAAIIAILSIRGTTSSGIFAALVVAVAVWLTDTGAYFAGRLFGGAKLSPDISPSKTWSGAWGGLVTGALCAMIVWLFASPATWLIGLGFAVLISIVGQLGDLAESALKRRFRIKDSGDILPGHGGLMDRLDSLTAAALTVFLIGTVHGGPGRVAEGFLYWP